MEKIRARAALSGVKSHPGTRVCRRGVTRTKCVLFPPPRRRRGRNTPRRRGRRWKTTGRQIQMNRKDLAASGARAFTIWLKTRDPGAEPRLFCINAIVIRNMLYCVSVREKRGLGGLGRRRAHSRPAEFGSNCGFFVRFVFSPTFAAKWPDGGFAQVVVKKKKYTHTRPADTRRDFLTPRVFDTPYCPSSTPRRDHAVEPIEYANGPFILSSFKASVAVPPYFKYEKHTFTEQTPLFIVTTTSSTSTPCDCVDRNRIRKQIWIFNKIYHVYRLHRVLFFSFDYLFFILFANVNCFIDS